VEREHLLDRRVNDDRLHEDRHAVSLLRPPCPPDRRGYARGETAAYDAR
jgi:hypothetical protein